MLLLTTGGPLTNLGNSVWSIAGRLRGVVDKPHQYGNGSSGPASCSGPACPPAITCPGPVRTEL